MKSSRTISVLLALNIIVMGAALAAFFMTQRPFTGDVHAAEDSDPQKRVELADPSVYQFLPVEKIIIGVRGTNREHYAVIDLALQVSAKIDIKTVAPSEPLVRNAVVAHLSGMSYQALRTTTVKEMQASIENAIFTEFAARNLKAHFDHVLVNKILMQ